MFVVLSSLLNSPLVWFAVLVVALTAAGLGILIVIGGNRKPTPPMPEPHPTGCWCRSCRYHNDNSIGRN